VLSELKILIVILVLSYIIQVASKRKLKISYPLILLISMVLLSLLEPNGKVVFRYFTDVSLTMAFTKAIRILILIASSQILVGSTTINIGFVEDVFALSSIILDKFSKSKGSIINKIDEAIIGDSN
jgi:heptaprenyl diphosphate synthase